MTRERWEDLKGSIKDRFELSAEFQEPLDDRPGTADVIEFETPAGKFRLEFIEAAKVTGVVTSSGKKIGTAGRIARTFSSDESIVRMDAYRWGDGSWQRIDPETFTG